MSVKPRSPQAHKAIILIIAATTALNVHSIANRRQTSIPYGSMDI